MKVTDATENLCNIVAIYTRINTHIYIHICVFIIECVVAQIVLKLIDIGAILMCVRANGQNIIIVFRYAKIGFFSVRGRLK